MEECPPAVPDARLDMPLCHHMFYSGDHEVDHEHQEGVQT